MPSEWWQVFIDELRRGPGRAGGAMQSHWHGHELPKLAETKNVTKVVANLVLCSLQKVPGGRLTSALPSFTANETGKMFMWQGNLMVGSSKSLPVSITVYVSDLIYSLASSGVAKVQSARPSMDEPCRILAFSMRGAGRLRKYSGLKDLRLPADRRCRAGRLGVSTPLLHRGTGSASSFLTSLEVRPKLRANWG
jgi:hypothetical protein